MKIGIVCYPSLGGSGIVATELGHLLADKGHEIHFITYEPPFRLRIDHKKIFFHQVDIHQYDLFRYPDYALTLAVKIAEVSKLHQLDIVHVHYAIPHATSAYLAKQLVGKTSPKIVTTLHGTDITIVGKDPAYFEIVKFSIEQSDAVTAVSESLKRETLEYFQVNKEIEVIPNFYVPDKHLIGKKPLRNNFVSLEEKLLIHASNFRRVKRIEDVIKIFALIQKKIPAKLLLVGTGSGFEEARGLVHQMNLQKNVFFIGKTREVGPYIASSDLFLLPSAHESFGLVALEAMSYGVPVIASDVGGLPEVVKHGETGFLAPVGNIKKMVHDALTLLEDPVLYHKFSERAVTWAKTHFQVDRILEQYEALYQKVC